jgi:hypothetical protein
LPEFVRSAAVMLEKKGAASACVAADCWLLKEEKQRLF